MNRIIFKKCFTSMSKNINNINQSEEKNLIRQQNDNEGCDLEDGVDAPEFLG